MITSTFIIAIVVYFVFNFAFTAPWNLFVFKKQYDEMTGAVQREHPIMPLGMLAMLIEATAMAVIFSMFYTGGILQALELSLLIGLFSFLYGALVVPVKFKIEPVRKEVALELAHGITQFVGIGLIFAFIFS